MIKKIKYHFENILVKRPSYIFLILAIVFVIALAIISSGRLLTIVATDNSEALKSDYLWKTWLEMTDPGNMNQDNLSPWFIKIFAVISGIFGVIVFSVLTAYIVTKFEEVLRQVRLGNTEVFEKEPTIILGWNEKIFDIIHELILANESESKFSLIILSSKSKEYMDHQIFTEFKDTKTTKIITRTGSIFSSKDLSRVGITRAKNLMILVEDSHIGDEDSLILKTLLAVKSSYESTSLPPIISIVKNDESINLLKEIGPSEFIPIESEDLISKIFVQTSRSIGLAEIYRELTGFDGSEIYIYEYEGEEMEFYKLFYNFIDGIPMGVYIDGVPVLNPDIHTLVKAGDELIILAEDDSTIKLAKNPLFNADEPKRIINDLPKSSEVICIVGWNPKLDILLSEYGSYLEEGSAVHIIIPSDTIDDPGKISEDLKKTWSNFSIIPHFIDELSYDGMHEVYPENVKTVLLLNRHSDNHELSDTQTIKDLVLVQSVVAKSENSLNTQIIAELNNSQNLELVMETGVHDVLISNQIISSLATQVLEDYRLFNVYEELFKEEGSELYLKPVELYNLKDGDVISFFDIQNAVQGRNEVCIGLRQRFTSYTARNNYEITVNPLKEKMFKLNSGDLLIVLSEDES